MRLAIIGAYSQTNNRVVGAQVTRQAVAQYIMDLLHDPSRDLGVSVGIVEPGSEALAKPVFY